MEYTKDVIFNVRYGKNKITSFKFRKEQEIKKVIKENRR